MASYFLLYSSPESIRRYRVASIYMPLGLLALGAYGLWMAAPPHNDPSIVQGILAITALYLALHYTGQTWGMMASYAYLHGIRFSNRERVVLRGCLRVMVGWHMVWALRSSPAYVPAPLLPWAESCMQVLNIAALVSLAVGIFTLLALRRRLQSPLPASLVFVSLINIHHYFIDGCIWHIRNPEVRADLFAHIRSR